MTTHSPRKFVFETEFLDDVKQTVVPPRPQRLYTRDDVEKIRQECFDRGQTTALVRTQELIVQAQDAQTNAEEARVYQEELRVAAEHQRIEAEQRTLEAVDALIQHSQHAFTAMASVSLDHSKQAAKLAMIAAKQIAGEALKHFPQGAVLAAMDALASEIKAQPRLTVRAGPEWADRFQTALDQKIAAMGLDCRIQVTADSDLPLAAFDFNWGDGRAQFDPVRASEKISAALQTALAGAGVGDGKPSQPPSQTGH